MDKYATFNGLKIGKKNGICIFFSMVGLIGAAIDTSNSLGWIVMGLTYWIAFLYKPIRSNSIIFAIAISSILSHQLISILSLHGAGRADHGGMYLMQPDALGFAKIFHQAANQSIWSYVKSIWNTYSFDSGMKVFYLEFIIAKMQNSILFINSLVITFFALFLCVVAHAFDLFSIKKYRRSMFALIAFMPNQLIVTSILLRESQQVFFFSLIVASLVHLIQTKKLSVRYSFAFFFFSLMFSALHHKFYVFLTLANLFTIIYLMLHQDRKYHKKIIFFLLSNVISLLVVFHIPANPNSQTQQMIEIIKAQKASNARSSYFDIKFNTPIGSKVKAKGSKVKAKGSKVKAKQKLNLMYFFNTYLCSQFGISLMIAFAKWGVANAKFVIAVMYYLLIDACFISFVIALTRDFRQLFSNYHLLLFLWYAAYMCGVGVFTQNYGTMLRHSIIVDWIKIMLGLPLCINYIKKIYRFFYKWVELNDTSMSVSSK